MPDTTYDPTKNSIAAEVQARLDRDTQSAPRDTSTWDHASATVYQQVVGEK